MLLRRSGCTRYGVTWFILSRTKILQSGESPEKLCRARMEVILTSLNKRFTVGFSYRGMLNVSIQVREEHKSEVPSIGQMRY